MAKRAQDEFPIDPRTGRPFDPNAPQSLINPETGHPFAHGGTPDHMNISNEATRLFDERGGRQSRDLERTPPRYEFDVDPFREQAEQEFATGTLPVHPSGPITDARIQAELRNYLLELDQTDPLPGGRSRVGGENREPFELFHGPDGSVYDNNGVLVYKLEDPDGLSAEGRRQFEAAKRGELPGYEITDQAARALFARHRMSDLDFGRPPGQGRQDDEYGGGFVSTEMGMDEHSRRILEERYAEYNKRIQDALDAGKPANYDDRRIRDNIARILFPNFSADRNRGSGRRDSRPYRFQTGHVGSARGGGFLTSNRGRPGSGVSTAPAYESGTSLGRTAPSGPLPDSLRESVSPDGTTFTTSDGFSFPNVTGEGGMSEEDFSNAMAANPQADDELLEYAEGAGLITDSVRQRLNELDPNLRDPSVSARQAPQVAAAVASERGRLLYGIAQDASRHEEQKRASAIRAEAAAERAAQVEARRLATEARTIRGRQVSEAARLRRIYYAYVHPQTKSLLIDTGVGLEPVADIDQAGRDIIASILVEEQRQQGLTAAQYAQAREWEEEQRRRSLGIVGPSVQQEGQAPVTDGDPTAVSGPAGQAEPVSTGPTEAIKTPHPSGFNLTTTPGDPTSHRVLWTYEHETGERQFSGFLLPDLSHKENDLSPEADFERQERGTVVVKVRDVWNVTSFRDHNRNAPEVQYFFVPDESHKHPTKMDEAGFENGVFYQLMPDNKIKVVGKGRAGVREISERTSGNGSGPTLEQPVSNETSDSDSDGLEAMDPFASNGAS